MKTITLKSKSSWLCALAALLLTSSAAFAEEITNMREALEAAMKDNTIAEHGDKAKLYSANVTVSPQRKSWSFRFYAGGDNLHTVMVTPDGKTRYSAYAKGSSRVFDDIDFSTLPAPSDIIIENAVEKSKKALTALGFEVLDTGKYNISYYLGSQYRQKDKAAHTFRVGLPIKHDDPKKGKQVIFLDGNIDQVTNTTVY